MTGEKISVGAPFFNLTFGPLFVPLLLVVPFGPLMPWKRGDLLGVAQRLIGAAGLAVVAIAAVFAVTHGGPVLAPFGIGLAAFVMAGAVTDLVERTGLLRMPLAIALARARGLPRSAFGTMVAHFGLGVSLLGIVCASTWGAELIVALKPKATISLRSYDLTFDGMVTRQGPNYRELAARFTVREGGNVIGVMEPSKRTFPSRQSSTTEAALLTRGVSQLYLSLGDPNDDGSIAVRLYHKPLVLLIWLGAVVMFFGGALSLSDRRLRIGAPKPAKARARDAAGGVIVQSGAAMVSLLLRRRCLLRCRRSPCSPTRCSPIRRWSTRARTLSRELRCMVCQNQSIDDSEAPLARDLRLLVRERLKAGDSDAQVLDFLVARYGQFVLLKPRFGWDTALLWLAPDWGAAGRRVWPCCADPPPARRLGQLRGPSSRH